MATESTEDKDVDALVTALSDQADRLQATLTKLKAAQRKDVDDEDSEESSEDESRPPLQRAERKAQRLRARDKASDTKSE